ncbi:MAG: 50S ribosomal protein L11 methyltransferase [Pseudomonadota bacterium]
MSELWKLSAFAAKPAVQAALLAHDDIEEWDPELVISGREVAEDRPQDWVLEAWYPRKPGTPQTSALKGLFPEQAPKFKSEKLAAQDWLTVSQANTKPIKAGRFHVRTPEFAPDPAAINFVIPAAQAFGTGHHETTASCLEMLGILRQTGLLARAIADIGTGTGLLGFAAIALWPRAYLTLSDIDPVCVQVVEENATLNQIALGSGKGAATMVIAEGLDHPLLKLRGPYDLLIANILAGPLVELANDFADNVRPGGSVVLAGLLAGEQERSVRRAYRAAGFRLVCRLQRGDWAILWLKRRQHR